MISVVLSLVAPAVAMSAAVTTEDPGLRMTSNGEFIAAHYPPKALKAGEQGKVSFRLMVQPDGTLGTCEVTGSSGYKSLDDETCELILRYARLQPARNADGRAVRAIQNGYINWKHPSGTGKAASMKQMAAADLPDKITCKKSATTGSLIKRTRQCMTNREWAETERQAKDRAYRLIASGHADKISTE